jgi:acetyltransferase
MVKREAGAGADHRRQHRPVFGPVILFGQGGTAVEVVADSAMALPPLNAPLARALIERTRVAQPAARLPRRAAGRTSMRSSPR